MSKFKISLPFVALFALGMTFMACNKDNALLEETKQTRFFAGDAYLSYESPACVGDVVVFTLAGWTGTQTVTLQYWDTAINDWAHFPGSPSNNASSPKSFEMTFAEAGNYQLRYNIAGGGNPKNITGNYILIENCGCVDAFAAVLDCTGDTKVLTVTYSAEEAGDYVVQGGLTNGTTIVSATSVGLTQNFDHPSLQNSNANVTRWEGYIGACETVTVTIEYTGGAGVGSWTAKLGEETTGSSADQGCN
jgi:hypothetical protein